MTSTALTYLGARTPLEKRVCLPGCLLLGTQFNSTHLKRSRESTLAVAVVLGDTVRDRRGLLPRFSAARLVHLAHALYDLVA